MWSPIQLRLGLISSTRRTRPKLISCQNRRVPTFVERVIRVTNEWATSSLRAKLWIGGHPDAPRGLAKNQGAIGKDVSSLEI